MNKTLAAAALTLALCAGARAQTTCPCNATGVRTANTAALVTLLSNRMVCASVGGEAWQEWHNGSTAAGGPVVDYKKGPSDPVDPSETVGSYAVGADNTVTYTYGSSSYKYAVCSTGSSYAYCGAAYGGRDVTGAIIGGAGLQNCSTVTPVSASTTRSR